MGKEDLEIATGSAPTDDEISAATSSPTSTSATSARRNIVARHLLNRFNQARPPSFHNKTKKELEKNDTRLTRTATTFNEDSSKDGGDRKDQCKLGRGQQNKKTQDVQNQYSLNPSS